MKLLLWISILIIFINLINNINSQKLPDGFCPSPLIYRNTTDRQGDIDNGYSFVGPTNCVQPCPSLLFSTNHWNAVFNMSLIAGSISMFCLIFLLITYGLVNRKHTKHTIGILFLFISILIMMTTDGRQLWDIGKGFSKYCHDNGARYARQHDTNCLVTAIFFQFAMTSGIMWWSILSVDLYMTIKKFNISKNIIYFYIAAINGISVVLTFVPYAKKQYGYSEAAIGCWLMDLKYQLIFFWVPCALCLIAGGISIGLILYEIYQASDAVKKKLLAKHTKPLCLITLMLMEFFYMLVFYSYVTSNKSYYYKTMEEYVTCLMINALKPSVCKINGSHISPAAHFIFHFCIRLMGFEGLVFFGFTRQTKRIWLKSYLLNNNFVKSLLPTLSTSDEKSTTRSRSPSTFGDPELSVELSGIESNNNNNNNNNNSNNNRNNINSSSNSNNNN